MLEYMPPRRGEVARLAKLVTRMREEHLAATIANSPHLKSAWLAELQFFEQNLKEELRAVAEARARIAEQSYKIRQGRTERDRKISAAA